MMPQTYEAMTDYLITEHGMRNAEGVVAFHVLPFQPGYDTVSVLFHVGHACYPPGEVSYAYVTLGYRVSVYGGSHEQPAPNFTLFDGQKPRLMTYARANARFRDMLNIELENMV